jgi:hypothetical protein
MKPNLTKLSDSSLIYVKKELKKKDNRGVPQHSHISFSKNYYEIQSSNQLSYGKNPNYVECFWFYGAVLKCAVHSKLLTKIIPLTSAQKMDASVSLAISIPKFRQDPLNRFNMITVPP